MVRFFLWLFVIEIRNALTFCWPNYFPFRTVRNNVVLHRPDLALLYYPPTFDFFWFASRTAFLLRHTENIPYDVMNKVRDVLSDAMENEGTKSLLGTVTYDYNNNWAYWDDFLVRKQTIIIYSCPTAFGVHFFRVKINARNLPGR